MRTLRWAAELAVSKEPSLAQLGVAELMALDASNLLEDSEKIFIDAALESTIHDPADAISEIESAGGDADVVEDLDADSLPPN